MQHSLSEQQQNDASILISRDDESPIRRVLRRQEPDRFVYAPNYWQWFTHHQRHGILPQELQHCRTQIDMIRYLEQDVFSRNIYCDPLQYWFGGLVKPIYDGITYTEHLTEQPDGNRLTVKTYETGLGTLTEELLYIHEQSTLIQKKHLIDSSGKELPAFLELVRSTHYDFDTDNYFRFIKTLRSDEMVVAGEVFSPLKLFHLAANPTETIFLLTDHSKECNEIIQYHLESQLAIIRKMVENKVEVVMAMDNLDSAFHTKKYLDHYSAEFYRRASEICHEYGALFFIHACGQQKAILKQIVSYGVDGLEGVSFPPLGDIELLDAFQITAPNFLMTGGVGVHQSTRFTSQEDADLYVRTLFESVRSFRNRFIFSASCNVPINVTWDSICYTNDAWKKYAR
jgi:hypothetical protein